MRLLFGTNFTFDHAEYYITCAIARTYNEHKATIARTYNEHRATRARTYNEHKATKNFVLEHTKPLFNDNNFLNLRNPTNIFPL